MSAIFFDGAGSPGGLAGVSGFNSLSVKASPFSMVTASSAGPVWRNLNDDIFLLDFAAPRVLR